MQQSFNALGVSAAVEHALADRGILEPFRIQSLVLPDALEGRDVLAKSPTGSGKTIAFGIPLVERTPRDGKWPGALVLVPTRELALQVAEEVGACAVAKGLRVGIAYGGVPVSQQAKRLRGAQIVVATPGRLQDLVERRLISLDSVRILVLDEADRMLDMGFKPQVERILRRLPRERQTMLFSATLDGEVGELARSFTRNPSRVEARPPAEQEQGEVEHRFVPVTAADKVERLVEELKAERGLALGPEPGRVHEPPRTPVSLVGGFGGTALVSGGTAAVPPNPPTTRVRLDGGQADRSPVRGRSRRDRPARGRG